MIYLEKVDYKKMYKGLYLPKAKPTLVNVPRFKFAVIQGKGDPNGEEFALATAALYSFSYAVKMSYKSVNVPENCYDYVVFPLEGQWDLANKDKSVTDKSNYKYKIMIRQPEFLTDALYKRFLSETKSKKPNKYLDDIVLQEIEEGQCCQMLHIGSYDDEIQSFNIMDEFCNHNGYKRISKVHREIYLSDPRKTEKSKLKTVLRYKVEKI